MMIFFLNDPATPEIYTLSLHDALPISQSVTGAEPSEEREAGEQPRRRDQQVLRDMAFGLVPELVCDDESGLVLDRKSTRLNSSHANISYAVFCLKKKKQILLHTRHHIL